MRLYIKLTLLILLSSLTFALDLSRSDFDRRIDGEGGYREVVLSNHSDKTIRYKFSVSKGKGERDMSQWVELYPKVMTIPPLEKRTLKIYAKSPIDTLKGEYSFYLNIDDLIVPTLKVPEQGKVRGTATISFAPSIEMLGYVGEPEYEKTIKFNNIKFEESLKKQYILGKLSNEGDIGANLVLRYLGSNEFVLGEKWLGRIGRKSFHSIKVDLGNGFKIKDIKKLQIYDGNDINRKVIKEIKI